MVSKDFKKTYRFELTDDDVPVFETRYYAQRFIDEFVSQWYPTHRFFIVREEDGFRVYYKGQVRFDKYDEPMVKYTYN